MPMITPAASSNVAAMVPVRVLTCGTPDANLWPNGLPCANGAPCAYGAVLSSSTAGPGPAGPWPWPANADRSASGAVATAAGASTWAIGGGRRPTGAIGPGAAPAFGGFRPPLQRMRPRAAHGPDPVEVTPAPDLVRGSPVRDGHLVKHDPNLPAPA